jgi:hypothetical protein
MLSVGVGAHRVEELARSLYHVGTVALVCVTQDPVLKLEPPHPPPRQLAVIISASGHVESR